MRGLVETVITGTETETLEIEILGVLDDGIGPAVPMIVGRFVDERGQWVGVAAGMSGSPVTIDGRLLGALSYSIGAFSKEPICGITPIDTMLDLETYPGGLLPWNPPEDAGADATAAPSAVSAKAPVPLGLVARGFHGAGLERAREELAALGLPVSSVAAPAAAGPLADQAGNLRPGDAVAALLVWGDLTLGATGTVSWRDGNELLAFGHPFLGFGRVEVPMAPAEIIWTVPSQLTSFKMSRIGDPIGVVEQDRLTAIRGRLGPVPEGLPVTIAVSRQGRPLGEHRVEVMRDPFVAPALVSIATTNVLINDLGSERDEAMNMDATIRLADGREIEVEASGPTPGSAVSRFGAVMVSRLGALTQAPVTLPDVASVEVKIDAVPRLGAWSITQAFPDRAVAEPGDDVRVTVELEGPRGERRRENLTVTVPDDAHDGTHVLLVASSRVIQGLLGSQPEALRRTATDAETYLEALSMTASDRDLDAVLVRRAEGIVTAGGRYPALPGTAHILLRSRPGGAEMYRSRWHPLASASTELERPIAESARVALRIERR